VFCLVRHFLPCLLNFSSVGGPAAGGPLPTSNAFNQSNTLRFACSITYAFQRCRNARRFVNRRAPNCSCSSPFSPEHISRSASAANFNFTGPPTLVVWRFRGGFARNSLQLTPTPRKSLARRHPTGKSWLGFFAARSSNTKNYLDPNAATIKSPIKSAALKSASSSLLVLLPFSAFRGQARNSSPRGRRNPPNVATSAAKAVQPSECAAREPPASFGINLTR